jgi:hypothetical protein
MIATQDAICFKTVDELRLLSNHTVILLDCGVCGEVGFMAAQEGWPIF